MPDIITFTMNPTVDRSAAVDRVVPGRKLRCDPPQYEPGGGGINVSRAIARLQGDSQAIYLCGGALGRMLRNLLDEENLNHRALPIVDMTRLNFTALEKETDQQFRFGMPGPKLEQGEWQRCLQTVRKMNPAPAYIVASGSLPRGAPDDFYGRLARLARECGSRCIVDTSGEALRHAAKGGVYLIKPNLRELRHLTEEALEQEAEQEAAVRRLVDEGKAEVIVLSLGAAGAYFYSKEAEGRIRAPTVEIKSRIGAGDSTVGAITLALARGKGLREAVMYGIAAGSAAVMTPGTELCRLEDTERLYERIVSQHTEEETSR